MDINPVDIVIHIINIVVLFLILRVLLYKPVRNFMNERRDRIRQQMDNAAKAQADADNIRRQYEELMESADEQIKGKLNTAAEQSNAEADDILRQAREKADALVAKGRARGEEEYKNRVADARDTIVDLSFDIAQKILGREVSRDDNKDLVNHFFEKKE